MSTPETTDLPDRLLNNTEAAAMLSVSPKTLVALRERGDVPFVRILDHAKGVRYSEKSLAAWIAEREQRAVSHAPPGSGAKRSKAKP
jgi:hypothetical protein